MKNFSVPPHEPAEPPVNRNAPFADRRRSIRADCGIENAI